jgi:hypothetical protein
MAYFNYDEYADEIGLSQEEQDNYYKYLRFIHYTICSF